MIQLITDINRTRKRWFLIPVLLLSLNNGTAYPVDGYEETHIRRLQAINENNLPAGGSLPMASIDISGQGVDELPAVDLALSKELATLLGENAPNYSVAVLDISNPGNPHFMVHNPDMVANVGSVGKMIVLFALFQQLADLYPDDIEARKKILRDTYITANDWIVSDYHVVPVFDRENSRIMSRRLQLDDLGNLWEYLDWMISASNNSAASMVIQQVILLEHFGREYPVTEDEHLAFLKSRNATQLGSLWIRASERPLINAGFDINRIRQGSPFTATANKYVQGKSSVGNTTDLVKLLNLIETGRFVDEWSSREAKRLLYTTQRRIRYASHPAMHGDAVYFKSGSLYSCMPEPDFVCRQYMGNKVNRLASIAVIESPAGNPELRYLVAVMSNVLKVNSAVAHQTLALRIHRLIESINKGQRLDIELLNRQQQNETGAGAE